MTRHATTTRQANIERLQALAGDDLRITYERRGVRNGFVIWTRTADVFGPVRYEVATAFVVGYLYRGYRLATVLCACGDATRDPLGICATCRLTPSDEQRLLLVGEAASADM